MTLAHAIVMAGQGAGETPSAGRIYSITQIKKPPVAGTGGL